MKPIAAHAAAKQSDSFMKKIKKYESVHKIPPDSNLGNGIERFYFWTRGSGGVDV